MTRISWICASFGCILLLGVVTTGSSHPDRQATTNANAAVHVPVVGSFDTDTNPDPNPDSDNTADHADDNKPLVLILDVDNTLYSEQEIQQSGRIGIEEQIIHNTHLFCQRHFANMTPEQADDLYRQYGSTNEGLRQLLLLNNNQTTTSPLQIQQLMERFYSEVYRTVNVSSLLPRSTLSSSSQQGGSTGYSHNLPATESTSSSLLALKELLLLQSVSCPVVYLASNSPSWHVRNVLRALGLHNLPFRGILAPDTISCTTDDIDDDNDDGVAVVGSYPTKAHPKVYYREILRNYPNHRLVLIEDSKLNLKRAFTEVGIEGVHVSHTQDGTNLEQALAIALGHVERANDDDNANDKSSSSYSSSSTYRFSDVKYLAAKNIVDVQSIHAPTWGKVAEHLAHSLADEETTLRIADVGAGILSMLEAGITGKKRKDKQYDLSPLDSLLSSFDSNIQNVQYYAYESNLHLFQGCLATLKRLGFSPKDGRRKIDPTATPEPTAGDTYVFRHAKKPITVHLCWIDFTENPIQTHSGPPHLIVGCCFADLIDPHRLVQSLHRFLETWQGEQPYASSESVLAYFPITFDGITQFMPPNAFAFQPPESGRASIPSDTAAFTMYADALTHKLGHNLNPSRLVSAMSNYGGTLLARGPSTWNINATKHAYLWDTMMYFFGSAGAPELMKDGWDALGWIHRAKKRRPDILVSNVDLLFRLPFLSSNVQDDEVLTCDEPIHDQDANEDSLTIKEIQFIAPNQVTTSTHIVRSTGDVSHLGPNQVEITSICSLISSGTELKIFKGMFDDAALDINIKGMDKERMAYPLAYGYSLVGRVTRCGVDVKDAEQIIGKLAFSFSPHASHAIVDRGGIQIVPDGIEAQDAIFMPSVETALSIVHDTHTRLGEKIAVFGQGMIGLLVTSILSAQHQSARSSGSSGTITVFDTLPDRLAAASKMGASEALLPSEAGVAGPFDVSIEISGNSRALQSAIDNTVSGGRIIVGSWYGNADITLKLGIDFHRSHKTIKTSQVSEIPAELSGLWNKPRRFGLTWELVRQIRPSRLLTKRATLDEAQEAYESLDKGTEISVCFDYTL